MIDSTAVIPWSRAELLKKMRDAGWKRIEGPASVYEHPETGDRFYVDRYTDERGVEWRWFANQRRLPTVGQVMP